MTDLTLTGWEQYEEMKHGSHDGGYGFFAWQFGSPRTKPIFEDVLKPAFKEQGYPLRDMKDLSQPGLIDNIMQERIRSASFVIVDLTDCNPGAYWEGGFAQALGKPVVYICHQEVFNDPATKPHFDTNHYTIVFWERRQVERGIRRGACRHAAAKPRRTGSLTRGWASPQNG